MIGCAIVGIFLSLLGAQFCKGWNVLVVSVLISYVQYICLQIILIINIIAGLFVCIGVNYVVPKEIGEITDPDTLAALKNVTDITKGFLDRNQDFPQLYTKVQEALDFCGFYSKEDSMGISCPYSSAEVCSHTDKTLLSLILIFVKKLLGTGINNLLLFLIIETVVVIILIIAYRSIKLPNELKKKEYSLSTTQPTVVNESQVALISSQNQPNTIPGMPANGQNYYYAQPVGTEPAKPVMSQ